MVALVFPRPMPCRVMLGKLHLAACAPFAERISVTNRFRHAMLCDSPCAQQLGKKCAQDDTGVAACTSCSRGSDLASFLRISSCPRCFLTWRKAFRDGSAPTCRPASHLPALVLGKTVWLQGPLFVAPNLLNVFCSRFPGFPSQHMHVFSHVGVPVFYQLLV